jgi:hypothetical protein
VLETNQLCEPLQFDVAQQNLRAKIEKIIETALIEGRSPNLHANFRKKKMKSK